MCKKKVSHNRAKRQEREAEGVSREVCLKVKSQDDSNGAAPWARLSFDIDREGFDTRASVIVLVPQDSL